MTRDAKIGLLLGLAFIFMIAFIINGLPGSRPDSNELTTTMANFPNNPPGLAAREREVINRTESIRSEATEVLTPPIGDPRIRDQRTLPQNPVIPDESNKVEPVVPGPVNDKQTDVRKSETVKPALPKIYTVTDGDNLASIAKKFYGPEAGNKRANIMKIFEANRKILESPDDIYVGQKLVIPPLPGSAPNKEQSKSIFPSEIFKKVISIGREHLSKNTQRAEQSKLYTVKEGDNLWQIAAEQLGDGSRYKEIVRLNTNILEDEDTVGVGTALKMPAR
ncbi:MAG TPA: LysM peptidoglycan-binding domain-containing protein [Sedimentisphaerales bacterium]|nr:LysM peptidoglycan-binding domain-containing protein [Sedimentisphaerales bacterium]